MKWGESEVSSFLKFLALDFHWTLLLSSAVSIQKSDKERLNCFVFVGKGLQSHCFPMFLVQGRGGAYSGAHWGCICCSRESPG